MDITFKCDKCGQQIAIDEAGAGMSVQCPSCGVELIVPTEKRFRCLTRADLDRAAEEWKEFEGYNRVMLVLYRKGERIISDVLLVDGNDGGGKGQLVLCFRAAWYKKGTRTACKLPIIEWVRRIKLQRGAILYHEDISPEFSKEIGLTRFTYDREAYRNEVRRGQTIAWNRFGEHAEFNRQAYGEQE
jgi:DNA-directed RNA polymerase subunit RPC12/RpoP